MAKKFCRLQADDKKSLTIFFNESIVDEDGDTAELPWRSTVLQLTKGEGDQRQAMIDRAKIQLKSDITAAKAAQPQG